MLKAATAAIVLTMNFLPTQAVARQPTIFPDYEFYVREFIQFTDEELILIVRRGAEDIVLDGYSHNMSERILYMSRWNRRGTFRLLRDMERLTTRSDRVARLQRELDRTEALIDNLEASVERLEAKDRNTAQTMALREEENRLANMNRFKRDLEVWIDFPMEGTR